VVQSCSRIARTDGLTDSGRFQAKERRWLPAAALCCLVDAGNVMATEELQRKRRTTTDQRGIAVALFPVLDQAAIRTGLLQQRYSLNCRLGSSTAPTNQGKRPD
jgi:hypothetical protein